MLGTHSKPHRGQMSHICDTSALRVKKYMKGVVYILIYRLQKLQSCTLANLNVIRVLSGCLSSVALCDNGSESVTATMVV